MSELGILGSTFSRSTCSSSWFPTGGFPASATDGNASSFGAAPTSSALRDGAGPGFPLTDCTADSARGTVREGFSQITSRTPSRGSGCPTPDVRRTVRADGRCVVYNHVRHRLSAMCTSRGLGCPPPCIITVFRHIATSLCNAAPAIDGDVRRHVVVGLTAACCSRVTPVCFGPILICSPLGATCTAFTPTAV